MSNFLHGSADVDINTFRAESQHVTNLFSTPSDGLHQWLELAGVIRRPECRPSVMSEQIVLFEVSPLSFESRQVLISLVITSPMYPVQ